jgi:telomere length regulation protein
MTELLTAVSTKKAKAQEPLLQEVKSSSIQTAVHVDSAKSALEALKSQPSQETVTDVLRYMTTIGSSLLLPEPWSASIAHQLVNDTIPHYWRPFHKLPQAKLLAKVLRNPTGVGHIITRLRTLIADSRQKKAQGENRDAAEHIEDMIGLLDGIYCDEHTSSIVLRDIQVYGKSAIQRQLIWREYLAQTASGRLVSIVAEAEDVLKSKSTTRIVSWLADGSAFAEWLGRNIALLMKGSDMREEDVSAVTELCSKALTLGYTGQSKSPDVAGIY